MADIMAEIGMLMAEGYSEEDIMRCVEPLSCSDEEFANMYSNEEEQNSMGLLDWIFGALSIIILVVLLLFLASIGIAIYNSLEDKSKAQHLEQLKHNKEKDDY